MYVNYLTIRLILTVLLKIDSLLLLATTMIDIDKKKKQTNKRLKGFIDEKSITSMQTLLTKLKNSIVAMITDIIKQDWIAVAGITLHYHI